MSEIFEMKITVQHMPDQQYYYIKFWEREVEGDKPGPWQCLITGGIRQNEMMGRHRQVITQAIKRLCH